MEFIQEPTSDGVVIALRGSFTFKDHHGFRAVLDALVSLTGGVNYNFDVGMWRKWLATQGPVQVDQVGASARDQFGDDLLQDGRERKS